MSGWGVIIWLAASAAGPLTFLALVAHRVADCTIGLEQLKAEQQKSQRLQRAADPEEIVLKSTVGHRDPTPPANKNGQGDKKVDQPLG